MLHLMLDLLKLIWCIVIGEAFERSCFFAAVVDAPGEVVEGNGG
jgi:hypothetical protein